MRSVAACAIACMLGACVEAEEVPAQGSGGETLAGADESTTAEESEESSSSGEGDALPCGWIEGALDEPEEGTRLSVAFATCDVDAEGAPVARLQVANRGAGSCNDPSASPPCSVGYAEMRIDLPPDMQTVGTHDLEGLEVWVDMQGGGTYDDDCGGYVGGPPSSGTLTITEVATGGIEGYVDADMGDELVFEGSFYAVLCPD